jgi:hypothetical protein
VAENSLL